MNIHQKLQWKTVAIVVVAAVLGLVAVPADAGATSDKPVVYLTFDDGPSEATPRYLELLDRYDADATFFVMGSQVRLRPQLARRIVDEGHAIANHTYSHPNMNRLGLGFGQMVDQLTRTNDEILAATGVRATCFRPPYGATNQTVFRAQQQVGVANDGWTANHPSGHLGGWDIDTNDWRSGSSGISQELNKIRGGEVVLMHDLKLRAYVALSVWLAANHDRFEFRALPGCGATVPEPVLPVESPEIWYRFQIARLYVAYFDRTPDQGGWEFWNDQYVNGMSLVDISQSFSRSAEFAMTHGGPSDSEFIELVYQSVLKRQSDATGFAFWSNQMGTGMNRGHLVVEFSESAEFVADAGERLTGSCWTGQVASSYRCAAASTAGISS